MPSPITRMTLTGLVSGSFAEKANGTIASHMLSRIPGYMTQNYLTHLFLLTIILHSSGDFLRLLLKQMICYENHTPSYSFLYCLLLTSFWTNGGVSV